MADRPLRVLHVISGDLWAGAEVQAFTLLTNLQREGVIVAVALMNEGELARRLRSRGIAVHIFDETCLGPLRILAGLMKLIRQWQPDVIHTHRTKENILGSIANRLSTSVPSLRTVHGAPEHLHKGWRQLHKRLMRHLDSWCGKNLQQRIIAVSADLAHKLHRDFRYPERQIVIVENGVDAEDLRRQIRPAGFRRETADAIHVGIVGRLVPVKRVDIFLATALELIRTHPERKWRFHVFGDGPLQDELKAYAATSHADELTVFHGHRDDIVACIAELDALVICSDHEGLPMALLEAMTSGTPIVAHDVGGIPAALAGHPAHRLVDHHTAAGYAEAIHSLTAEFPFENHRSPKLPIRLDAQQNVTAIRRIYEQLIA